LWRIIPHFGSGIIAPSGNQKRIHGHVDAGDAMFKASHKAHFLPFK
jgi:hypothetical protein